MAKKTYLMYTRYYAGDTYWLKIESHHKNFHRLMFGFGFLAFLLFFLLEAFHFLANWNQLDALLPTQEVQDQERENP